MESECEHSLWPFSDQRFNETLAVSLKLINAEAMSPGTRVNGKITVLWPLVSDTLFNAATEAKSTCHKVTCGAVEVSGVFDLLVQHDLRKWQVVWKIEEGSTCAFFRRTRETCGAEATTKGQIQNSSEQQYDDMSSKTESSGFDDLNGETQSRSERAVLCLHNHRIIKCGT